MSQTGYVYKIVRRDRSLPDCYIGSSKDMKQRRHYHRRDCNSPSAKAHNSFVYQFIREHDGFDEWDFVILEKVLFDEKLGLTQAENRWIDDLKPSLNSRRAPTTATICRHERQGRTCIECDGACVCEHKRRRARCVPCGGASCKPEAIAQRNLKARERRARIKAAANIGAAGDITAATEVDDTADDTCEVEEACLVQAGLSRVVV